MTGTAPAPATDDHDPRPVVRLPRSGLSGGAIALAGVLIASLLFLILDARRDRAATAGTGAVASSPTGAFRDPPPLTVPSETPPAAPILAPPPSFQPGQPLVPLVIPSPPAAYHPPQAPAPSPPVIVPMPPAQPFPYPPPSSGIPPASAPQGGAPALVVDLGGDAGTASARDAAPLRGVAQANTSQAGGEDAPVRAAYIANRTDIMPVGTLIPAVLETPIDTARPGLVRAVVSRDTRGFDGRHVLVPRGSRLIGEYQSEVRGGQNRVLVTWTRLVRPDGATIRIGSPAADALGGAGVPGQVHSFFFQRFASAVLQSALNVGVALASRPGRGSVIVGIPSGTIGNVGQTLLPANDLRPKITVKSGAVVNVFVARDLDFSGTGSKP